MSTSYHPPCFPGNHHCRNAAIQKQLPQGKGGYAVKTHPPYCYADRFLDLLFNMVSLDPALYVGKMCKLSLQCKRPDKEEAIAEFVSRFSLGGD